MKYLFFFTIIMVLYISTVANAQNYFADTVWTKNTDQDMGFYQVKFSNTDSIIVGHGYEKAIFYNAFTGEEIARLPFNAEVHFIDNDNKYIQLAPSRDRLVIYDTKTLLPLDTIENDGRKIGKIDISNDETFVVGVITNGLRIWDLQTGKIINTRIFEGEPGLIKWSGMQIKILCTDNELFVMEIKSYPKPNYPNETINYLYFKKYSLPTLDSLDKYPVKIGSFRISHNCQYLAYKTGDPTNGVEIYDFNSKQLLHKLPINGPSLRVLEFSPDDKYLITNPNIMIWDLATGENTYVYTSGSTNCLDVSHDGKYLFSSVGSHIYKWYARFGNTSIHNKGDNNYPLLYPNPATGEVNINIPPSNKRGSGAMSVKIYDVHGKCVLTVPIHPMTRSHRMNINSLPAGEYILVLEGKSMSQSYKLIINR